MKFGLEPVLALEMKAFPNPEIRKLVGMSPSRLNRYYRIAAPVFFICAANFGAL